MENIRKMLLLGSISLPPISVIISGAKTNIIEIAYKVVFLSEKFLFPDLPYCRKHVVLSNTINAPANFKTSPKENCLLYISNYIEEKGIMILLQAFSSYQDKSLNLKCYGQFTSNSIKEKVLSYSKDNIKINGPIIEANKKFSEISSASCLILPSYNEGQPLILLEAMSVGTIVIATKVGDISNMLGHDYPFLIEPKSVSSLLKAIHTVQNMPLKNREDLSQSLKIRFDKLFSKDQHKEKLFEIFENCSSIKRE